MPALLAAIGGLILVSYLPALPPFWTLPPLALLFVLLCLRPQLRVAAAFVAALGWGIGAGHLLLRDQLPADLQGRDILVSGKVVGLPQVRAGGQRFLFAPLPHRQYDLPELVRLSWYDARALRSGDRCRLSVRLRSPRGLSNPGGFDYHTWLAGHGIGATGYVRAGPDNHCEPAPLLWSAGYWRQRLSDALARQSGALEHAAFLRALAIGDRQAIERDQWQLLQRTGTQHLMAISGLHIGLIAALGYMLGGAAGRLLLPLFPMTRLVPLAAIACSLLLSAIYAGLAGFSLPTQRALLMVALVHVCLLRRRPVPIFHIFALVMLLVLVKTPLAAHSLGFRLSFGAVAVLLLGFCGRQLLGAGRLRRYLGQSLWSQWVVLVGLLVPLSCFGLPAALLSPLANTVAIPLVSWLVVPILLLGCALLELAPALALEILRWADRAFNAVWSYLRWIDQLTPATSTRAGPAWLFALVLAGGLLLLAPRHLPARWLGLFCLLPLFLPQPLARPPLQLVVLDVGQGLAAVISTPHHTLVYDAGPRYRSGFNTGAAVIVPYLQRRDIGFVDRLIISHADIDHSGGAEALAAAVATGTVLTGEPGPPALADVEPCVAGQAWEWDGVQFEILSPARPWQPDIAAADGNERSCVLLITYCGERILLPGDIGVETERPLLRKYLTDMPLAVLLAPHHGSDTSSGRAWVAALRPRFVVFSAGYRNRYGHPHAGVQERYRRAGSTLLNTAYSGAVTFRWLGPSQLQVSEARRQQRRYWFAAAGE